MTISNGRYSQPPDIDRMIQELFHRFRGGAHHAGRGFLWIVLGIVLLWFLLGTTIIGPDEEGVMLVFGRVTDRVDPGLRWNWFWPVGKTEKVSIKAVRKLEVGFRTVAVRPTAQYRPVLKEARMITGDDNIVELEFIVQYRIKDPIQYLFRVVNPEEALRDASEAAMREVIGHTEIDLALTGGKSQIQLETQELIQSFMDLYEAGIQVVTVKLQDVNPPDAVNDAFKDVQNALQDKERKINEAKGFQNDIIPAARGRAAQTVNQAGAYRQARITEAQGEAERFRALLAEYRKAKVVTRKRLYLERMEEILGKLNLTILEGPVSANTLPYLPLRELSKNKPNSKGGAQ